MPPPLKRCCLFTANRCDNYPGFSEGISGMELAKHLEEHARKIWRGNMLWNGGRRFSREGHRRFVVVDGKKIEYTAIIVSGGSRIEKLEVKGEDKLRKRRFILRNWRRPFYRNKNIVVVGGGLQSKKPSIRRVLPARSRSSIVAINCVRIKMCKNRPLMILKYLWF